MCIHVNIQGAPYARALTGAECEVGGKGAVAGRTQCLWNGAAAQRLLWPRRLLCTQG